MIVSTRGRYALRVLLDMAQQNGGEYITLRDVAQRQQISEKYLESIISLLVKNGIVEGMRGKGGGYKLTRRPEEYTIGEIIRITEGELVPVSCIENEDKCIRKDECLTRPMWLHLGEMINDYLDGIRLSDLLQNKNQ